MNRENSDDITIICKSDLQKEDVQGCINTIKEKNTLLGVAVEQYIKAEGSRGLREDVLSYFRKNAAIIGDDQDMIYNLISLLGKTFISPAWYEWIRTYFGENQQIPMDDFMTLLQGALEKKIPLEKLKDIFQEGNNSMLQIYEAIEAYVEEQWDGETIPDEDMPTSFPGEQKRSEIVEKYREQDISYSGVFGEILSVVSGRNAKAQELVMVQEHLNGYAGTLQSFVNDIRSFSGNVVNEWQKDREENARLKALYNMQQKLLESQQGKIDEMRTEIFRLNGIIQEYEKVQQHHAEMSRKINELHLMSDESGY